MKGTEKQIKFAESLIKKMEESANELKEKMSGLKGDATKYVEIIDNYIGFVKSQEKASDVIASRQDDENTGWYLPTSEFDWKIIIKEQLAK